jgi:hypothetical protein
MGWRAVCGCSVALLGVLILARPPFLFHGGAAAAAGRCASPLAQPRPSPGRPGLWPPPAAGSPTPPMPAPAGAATMDAGPPTPAMPQGLLLPAGGRGTAGPVGPSAPRTASPPPPPPCTPDAGAGDGGQRALGLSLGVAAALMQAITNVVGPAAGVVRAAVGRNWDGPRVSPLGPHYDPWARHSCL